MSAACSVSDARLRPQYADANRRRDVRGGPVPRCGGREVRNDRAECLNNRRHGSREVVGIEPSRGIPGGWEAGTALALTFPAIIIIVMTANIKCFIFSFFRV